MTDRTDVWTYLSATSVTVPTDLTATYYSGLKTKITQTTDKYFRIESSSYNAGTGLTTINLNGFGIYTVANAPITAHSDMCAENVAGFPLAFEGSGRAGGQTITGGTASGDDFTIRSTSHATKGDIIFGTSKYDEANNRLGIGRTPSTYSLEVQGDIYSTGSFRGDVVGTASGNVVGPGSAVDGNIVLFDKTTGKLIKDGLCSPSSFATSAHNHSGSDINSGTLDGDRLPAISTTKNGGVPATGTPSGKFLKDNGTWATVTGTGDVVGPSSATDGNFVLFDTVTGKLIKDSTYSPASFALASDNLGSYDSIVYVSGSDVIAKNAAGSTIDSGTHNTDDSNVIQTAINAGGAVLLAHTSFTLEAPLEITTSGVRLYSNSRSVTLSAKNSLNDNMIEITGTGVCRVTLSNLILDGNKANQTSGNAIYINTPYSSEDANHLLQNLHIKNVKGDGIVIAGDTRCCKLDHTVIMDGDGTGYTIAGSDHILNDASTGACKTGGFNISAGSIKAVTCKAFYCGQTSGVGIYVSGDRGTYIGCEVQDNYSTGWMLDGADNCLLTNCVGDSNGTTTDWQSGLVLNDSDNVIVTSGAFFDRQITPTQHWGVHITGTSTGCVVTYPSYSGNVTANYYDESSGTNYEVLPA